MTALPLTPALLLVGVVILLTGGVVTMILGKSLPRKGDWLVGLGILALLFATGLGWSVFVEEGFTVQVWTRGWIWPHDEPGAITVGVLRDALGLTVAALSSVVAVVSLFSRGAQAHQHRAERFHAALATSAAGVALSCFAITPWLALTGFAVTIFGGFLALGSQWEIPKEASIAAQFGWEKSGGLILAVLGLCVLAGGRSSLSLINSSGTGSWLSQSANSSSDLLGAGMIFLGAFVQLQPFPLLGWVLRQSESPAATRIILCQVFPAWAVFPFLLRLEPQFREIGVFPTLGWLGLASALFAAMAGIFSTEWRLSLGAWTSAGFSIAVAALAFAGPSPALSIVVGVGLGASALASFASAIEEGGEINNAGRQRCWWARLGCVLAAAVGTGLIGFVGAGGGIRWMSQVSGQPVLLTGSVLVFFLFAFLGWKVACNGIALKSSTQASWVAVLAPFLLILAALGIVWTGLATGGVIPGNPDRVMPPLMGLIFGGLSNSIDALSDESAFIKASVLYWGSLLVAMGAAFWTAGRRPDTWPKVARSMPRFSAFVASGYGVDRLFVKITDLLAKVGEWSQWLLDRKVWGEWIPGVMSAGLTRGASTVSSIDNRFSRSLGGTLRRPVEIPSKLLQLIQNGDVQWYLFFAVGSGVAILVHFLRT